MGRLMAEFIPAEELKSKFGVFGHFYSVLVAPKKSVQCRSVLEIVETDHAPQKTAALYSRKPNAVFIMMNPGSSRPLAEVNNRIHAKAIHELPISLVPTKPDTTQYQVMRVMHYCEWRHDRVLNLSDMRCPKSGVFFKQFKGLEEEHLFDNLNQTETSPFLHSRAIIEKAIPREVGLDSDMRRINDDLAFVIVGKMSNYILLTATTNKDTRPIGKSLASETPRNVKVE